MDKEPLKVGGRPAEYIAGLSAFSGAMIALYAQRASGEGQHVDVSMVEAIATAQMYSGLNYAYLGENRVRANDIAPMYQVSNGHVGVMYRQGNWDDFCDMIGRPEMKDDERFIDNVARRENIIELNQIVSEWMIKQDKTELYHLAQGQRMPFGYICDAEDLISSEQYIHRGYFVEIDHPVCGKLLYPGHSFFAIWEQKLLKSNQGDVWISLVVALLQILVLDFIQMVILEMNHGIHLDYIQIGIEVKSVPVWI